MGNDRLRTTHPPPLRQGGERPTARTSAWSEAGTHRPRLGQGAVNDRRPRRAVKGEGAPHARVRAHPVAAGQDRSAEAGTPRPAPAGRSLTGGDVTGGPRRGAGRCSGSTSGWARSRGGSLAAANRQDGKSQGRSGCVEEEAFSSTTFRPKSDRKGPVAG